MIFENSCNIHYTWPKVHKVYNSRRQLTFQTIYFLPSGLPTRKVNERVLDYLCFHLKRRARNRKKISGFFFLLHAIESPSLKSGVTFDCTILLAFT